MEYYKLINDIFTKNKKYSDEEIKNIVDHLESRAGNWPDRSLKRMKKALDILNLKPIKVVNIVGTNGKGTVSKAIFDTLNKFNIRTALYTSPHLVNYNERIRTTDGLIEDDILYSLIEIVNILEKEIEPEFGSFTYFEVLTLVANIYFAYKNVNIAVLETGVGGKGDATSVVGESNLSIITSISIDHVSALGDTVESIAMHKAGIMKRGAAITLNKGTALEVIKDEAAKIEDFKLYDYNSFKLPEGIPTSGEFEIDFDGYTVKINPKQFGLIRVENFSLAFAAIIKILQDMNIAIDLEKISESLSTSHWDGRMQVINKEPLAILDGAHNVDAIDKLFRSIESIEYDRLISIIAIMDRKAHSEMTETIRAKSNLLIITSNGDEHSIDIDLLSKESNADFAFDNIKDALEYAKKIANPNDLILITGSLYLVGEVLKII